MAAIALEPAAHPRATVRRTPGWFADVLVLTKARVNLLVVATTFVGFALHAPPAQHGLLLLSTLLGTGLIAAAAAVANQIRERAFDRQMLRTRQRPLAAGRIRPVTAVALGAILLVAGCVWLGWFVNLRALALAGMAFLIYALAYTPLKRFTPACTLVGAVAGALPVLTGWAATGAAFGWWAFTAFAVLFVWQIPHFLAIAWWHRIDYQRAGFQVLPRHDPHGRRTALWALAACCSSWVSPSCPSSCFRFGPGIGPARWGWESASASARRDSWRGAMKLPRGGCLWRRWFTCRPCMR